MKSGRPLTTRSRRMERPASAVILAVVAGLWLLVAASNALPGSAGPRGAASSGPTRVFLFNMRPGGVYSVDKNGANFTSVGAGPMGSMSFDNDVRTGDVFVIRWTEDNPVAPARPTGVQASSGDAGCAVLRWNTPDAGDYVYEYTLVWGPDGQSPVDSTTFGNSAVASQGGVSSYTQCGLSPGRYCFVLRAHNSYDLWSPYSAQACADLTDGDGQGPVVSDVSPADGATGVPTNASVRFRVRDVQAGVDVESITVTIDGTAAAAVDAVGDPGDYAVVARPAAEFEANSSVVVEVTVADLASPPNETTASWSFTTGAGQMMDQEPPVFAGTTPENGEQRAEPDTDIRVRVTDAGLGVDVASIQFFVNDAEVPYRVEGGSHDLEAVYDNEDPFPVGGEVSVRVVVCDLASPANCAELVDYTFTVGAGGSGLPQESLGVIVPNGFWAGDPSRPLEIRDIPVSWTVRIFDTAGRQVRSYTNRQVDGVDWLWDFNNDHGQRVARSMYLVRVTDADGSVRQSGRFLVQLDP